MKPKELHRIMDAELSKARNRRVKTEQTNATVKVLNAKLAYLRFQYQVMKETGVMQDFDGMVKLPATIEGKARRVVERPGAKVLTLKKKSA